MVTTRHMALLSFSVLLSAGCLRTVEVCPDGWVRDGDKCVTLDDAVAARDAESPGADGAVDTADAGPTPLPDASRSLPDGSTSPDASPSTGEAGVTEAGVDAADANDTDDATVLVAPDASTAPDATTDASDDGAVDTQCTSADLALWRDFHLSASLLNDIGSCIAADPSCVLFACGLDECLIDHVGLSSCQGCVANEVSCVVEHCVDKCGASDTNETCRACACANGCIDELNACSGQPIDVCSDCDGTTCLGASLDPALIMVVVNSVLL